MKARLLRIIQDADLRCRHDGLHAQAKSHGITIDKLQRGDVVAFVNTHKSMAALLTITGEENSLGLLSYYRSPCGRIEMRALMHLPECMGAPGAFDTSQALRKVLQGLLPEKRRKAGDDEATRR